MAPVDSRNCGPIDVRRGFPGGGECPVAQTQTDRDPGEFGRALRDLRGRSGPAFRVLALQSQRQAPGAPSGRWRAYKPMTRRDPDTASCVCHRAEEIERFGTTDQPIFIASCQHGFRVDGDQTSPPRVVDGWLVIAHESPVRVVSLKHINGLGLAEVEGRRVGARRAKPAPDPIDSDEGFDIFVSGHRRT